MRKFAFLLLLAGATAPTMASAEMQRSPRGSDDNPRAERVERAQRAERPQRAERAEQPQREQRVERSNASDERQRNFEMRRERSETRSAPAEERQRGTFTRQMRERVQVREQSETPVAPTRERSEWNERREGGRDGARDGARDGVRNWQPREREIRTVPGTQPVTVNRDRNRDGRYDRDRSGSSARHWDGRRWGREWRGDRRYDWRRYRDRNRSTFRLGFYFDPFGYSYRRYNVGSYMYPSYYQSNYWLDDPWQYRLPPVYGPYRWVRYHNDALLIDTWSGQIVDVIYGFFW